MIELAGSNLLNRDGYVLTVDVPLLGVGEGSAYGELYTECLGLDLIGVARSDCLYGGVAGECDSDVVHNLKAGILTHRLDLGDDLTHVTLLDKLGGEVLVDNYGHTVILE